MFEVSYRWVIAVAVLSLLAGSYSARRVAQDNADRLATELAERERERDALQEELDRFSDPHWRASYWKWRTMRHAPGEYYVDFVEPGIL